MAEVIVAESVMNKLAKTGERSSHAGDVNILGKEGAEFIDCLRAIRFDPSTIRKYLVGLRTFAEYLQTQSIADLKAVRRSDIVAFVVWLKLSGLSIDGVRRLMRVVCRFYGHLDREHRILVNPTLGIPLPKPPYSLPRTILTQPEVHAMLNAPDTSFATGVRDRALLEMLYSTGLRLAELCNLAVQDVNPASGCVRVNCGKGRKDRVVPMGTLAGAWLESYLRQARFALVKKHPAERALFVGERCGRRIHPKRVTALVHQYAQAAGIARNVTPHVFRHTCATHLLAGGADVLHVQQLLGHSSVNTTQIYTRVAVPDVKHTHAKTHPRERDTVEVIHDAG